MTSRPSTCTRRAVALSNRSDGTNGSAPSFHVDEVRADQRMVHARGARAQQREQIVKLAVADRLRVVAGGVDLGDDRLVAMIDRLASAQRVAAIEEQSRLALRATPAAAARCRDGRANRTCDRCGSCRSRVATRASSTAYARAALAAHRAARAPRAVPQTARTARDGSRSTASISSAKRCGVASSCSSSGTTSRSQDEIGQRDETVPDHRTRRV